jgi:hypothetical protein
MGWHSKQGEREPLKGNVSDELRRARLLAARTYPIGSLPRRGILSGQWDGGDIVRSYFA